LSWIHDKELVTIVRTTNEKHLQDNIAALHIKLESQEKDLLQNALAAKKVKVDLNSVSLESSPYSTVEEAITNSIDLIPSPLLLANRLNKGYDFSPLRLVETNMGYQILDGFGMSEMKKIWAWKISRPLEQMMEAYVFNDI